MKYNNEDINSKVSKERKPKGKLPINVQLVGGTEVRNRIAAEELRTWDPTVRNLNQAYVTFGIVPRIIAIFMAVFVTWGMLSQGEVTPIKIFAIAMLMLIAFIVLFYNMILALYMRDGYEVTYAIVDELAIDYKYDSSSHRSYINGKKLLMHMEDGSKLTYNFTGVKPIRGFQKGERIDIKVKGNWFLPLEKLH